MRVQNAFFQSGTPPPSVYLVDTDIIHLIE